MRIRSTVSQFTALFLALQFFLAPGLVTLALAQDAPAAAQTASDDEIQTIQQLAKNGYLGDQKDFYLNEKNMTEDQVTDALLKANDKIMAIDMKDFQTSKGSYQEEDLQPLLDLVKDKSADIRARKISAWKLENRLKKMIALLSTATTVAATPAESAAAVAPTATSIPATPTATPIPGPSRDEFNNLKESFKTLDHKLADVQTDLDKKTQTMADLQANGQDIKAQNADILEQLKLVKRLLDRVQDDLKRSEDRMNDIDKKVDQKMIADTEMQQDVTVMHKDLRDDTEDISVLKEQVAKLDKTDYGSKNAIDEFLTSKWLPGGALLVGLTALTVEFLRK